jgi:hypothetical protein
MSTATTTELAIPEIKNPGDLFVPRGLDPLYESIAARAKEEAEKLDVFMPAGLKGLGSIAYGISRYKVYVDDKGKEYKAELMKRIEPIDEERRRIRARFDALRDEIRAPLTAWEEADKARVAEHERARTQLEEIRSGMRADESSAQIEARIAALEPFRFREWEEFAEPSKRLLISIKAALVERLAQARKDEKARAEAEAFRKAEAERMQRERDEQLQWEAAENARIEAETTAKRQAAALAAKVKADAEKAERARLGAEALVFAAEDAARQASSQAQAHREAAAIKAKQDVDAAVQRERERAEQQKIADAHDLMKRMKQKAHRDKIEGEVFDAMIEATKDIGDVTEGTRIETIIEAIADGRIPHVKISY